MSVIPPVNSGGSSFSGQPGLQQNLKKEATFYKPIMSLLRTKSSKRNFIHNILKKNLGINLIKLQQLSSLDPVSK
jgi:hypothetical protein